MTEQLPVVVYLVSSGHYSDYSVMGIFSNRKDAEFYKATSTDTNDIEEFGLDELKEEKRGLWYQVSLNLKTGNVTFEFEFWQVEGDKYARKQGASVDEATYIKEDTRTVTAFSPKSRDHALKLAGEKRQEWLRTRAVQS